MERHTEDVNVSLDDAVNILTATSKICLKIKTKKSRKRIKATANKKWFDRECRLKRHELRKVSNQKHRDPFNSEIREKFHKTLTDYKKLLDSKRRAFQTEKSLKLDELGLNPNNASFWNCLKSMDDTIVENVPAPISEEKRSTTFNLYTLKTRELPYNNKKSTMSCNHWKKKKNSLTI